MTCWAALFDMFDRQLLLTWYRQHRRDLPWRRSQDPYAVWVSELMLQQTQVATVIPYFERWMTQFPSTEALANSSIDDVLSAWQGLGYYRRARSLHEGAKQIVENGMPRNATEWLEIKGVGRYTAGAIASIALGEVAPLVDGNVERVYARVTGDYSQGVVLTKSAWRWAETAVDPGSPGDWNQALMELGATTCLPRNPKCEVCPIKESCHAFDSNAQGSLPAVVTRPEVTRLQHFCRVIVVGGKVAVRQIPKGKWWQGMWEFPRFETSHELEAALPDDAAMELGKVTHSVTRYRIDLWASLSRIEAQLDGLIWMKWDELGAIAMPAPQRKVQRLAAPYIIEI